MPHGFQALNAEPKQSRRRFFVIFQDVIRYLLPSIGQELPTARDHRASSLQSSHRLAPWRIVHPEQMHSGENADITRHWMIERDTRVLQADAIVSECE
ncbi:MULTISPECIES: hypothetical protein [Bradyrhizobium]|uniref:hypothetical protein n=1 Tax=Bradyrhizobium TaxID=374 RepID=UPI001B8A28DF|nr:MULTISPECIES: hypothetical protein [Bradyrhizobium]MBR0972639.1 hypothetical protein [Bradyrhizobium japonicum]